MRQLKNTYIGHERGYDIWRNMDYIDTFIVKTRLSYTAASVNVNLAILFHRTV